MSFHSYNDVIFRDVVGRFLGRYFTSNQYHGSNSYSNRRNSLLGQASVGASKEGDRIEV